MFWFLGYKKLKQWIYLSLFSGFKTGLKVYRDLIDVSDWFEGSGGEGYKGKCKYENPWILV